MKYFRICIKNLIQLLLKIFLTYRIILYFFFLFLFFSPPLQNKKSSRNANATHRVAPQQLVILLYMMKKNPFHMKREMVYIKSFESRYFPKSLLHLDDNPQTLQGQKAFAYENGRFHIFKIMHFHWKICKIFL